MSDVPLYAINIVGLFIRLDLLKISVSVVAYRSYDRKSIQSGYMGYSLGKRATRSPEWII
jgi:hypothetical protein